MELIAKLIRIALEQASEHCLIAWHPDDDAPESFEAECEIDYHPSIWPDGRPGDYYVWFDSVLFCMVDASTMQCWTSSDMRAYTA